MTSSETIAKLYDQQADAYAEFADDRFAWRYLEKPAYDEYVADLYRPDARILDLGCGSGVVARHFISKGVAAHNIIGIDPSAGQLDQARRLTPGAVFIESSADSFELPSGSIDLVVTNTVLHHLDNNQLEEMLERTYDVLAPKGSYFFVDVDPDHSVEGRDPDNTNKWTNVRTPWNTEVPFFNRDPSDLFDTLDRHGFEKVSGWLLKVASAAQYEDPNGYAKYSPRPSRMAARFVKASEKFKVCRLNDVRISSIYTNQEQKQQRHLVDLYFEAWRTQSTEIIAQIFTEDAIYEEKPGKEAPISGICEIIEYWKYNPVSQNNIEVSSYVMGHSEDGGIWVGFEGGFDVRGEHVDIDGVIKFSTDLTKNKINHLTEYFKVKKSPLVSVEP